MAHGERQGQGQAVHVDAGARRGDPRAAALGWRWALVERAVGRPAAALAKRASRLGVAKITRRLPGETKAEYARWAQRRYNGRTGNLHGDNPLAEYAVAFGLPRRSTRSGACATAARCRRYPAAGRMTWP